MPEENSNIENEKIVVENREDSKKEKILVIKDKEKINIIDALKLIAPGTPLRQATNDIVKAKKGALIVLASNNLYEIIEGGFKLNCKFTPQKLFELSKMDGALILSSDLKKILYANCLLSPNPKIPSDETGTRHKAAERTAKQANTLVIAISERKNTTNLYYHNLNYSLKSTEEILNRTMEKLEVLEKQKEIYNNLMSNLNKLEITGLVTSNDVSAVLQRIEIVLRIMEMIKKDIIELGSESNLVKIRLKELTKNIEKNKKLLIKDYLAEKYMKQKEISKLNFDSLLELHKISEIIFQNNNDYIKPKGFRLLEKISHEDKELIINRFPDLNKILDSTKDELEKILKNPEKAEKFISELSKLKENIIMEKEI